MEIIEKLEPVRRGPYAGAVGYVSFSGNLDTCITIRTILFSRGLAMIQAGAGIVADSDPEREYEETMNKARGMRRGYSSQRQGSTSRPLKKAHPPFGWVPGGVGPPCRSLRRTAGFPFGAAIAGLVANASGLSAAIADATMARAAFWVPASFVVPAMLAVAAGLRLRALRRP